MGIKGLDVSRFQGKVDWEAVKGAGYRFAMLRAGYGSGTVDNEFCRNASECNRIGLPVGVYWFCYALDPEEARQEAESCMRTVSGFRLDYPICYDIEKASVDYAEKNGVAVTRELATEFIEAFCTRIEDYNYFAMFYCNKNFLNNYVYPRLSDRFALWYAYYNPVFDRTNCGIWQYTDKGRVPGIAGNVDLDISFYDYPYIIKKAGLNCLEKFR